MSIDDRFSASISIDRLGPLDTQPDLDIETLVRAYYPDVLRFARSIIADEAEADDVAQETFIAAAQNLHAFRGDSKVRTWLFGIAINLCRSALRKRKRLQRLQQALKAAVRLHPRPASPEEAADRSETRDRLRKAVAALDEKHRLPVILFYIHDFSVPEIAGMLDTSPGTVYSRLHYARKQLHRLIRF